MPFSFPGTSHPAEPSPCTGNTKPPRALQVLLRHLHSVRFVSSWLVTPLQAEESSRCRIVPGPSSPASTIPSAQCFSCTLHRGRTQPGNTFSSAPQTSVDITARNTDHRDCSKPSSVQLTPSQGQLCSSSPLSKLMLSLWISRVNMGQARR